jgi:uncharacterized protein (DUF2235 family)
VKHIILLSDGTGNSSAKLFKTNVWRVYQALDLADPKDPKQPRQFVHYDDGVGSSSFKPLAILGGALGVGLARNVRDLYAFLCRNYEDGDKIFAFGFSRGAFTIRVLNGLVLSQGLIKYNGDEAELQRLSAAAYRTFRRERFPQKFGLAAPLRWLRDGVIAAWNKIRRRTQYDQAWNIKVPRVEFLGLWDTVDAYGLPIDELTRAIDRWVWPLTMRDLNLHRDVFRARHALALDDERNTFHPRLWNEKPDPQNSAIGVPNGNTTTTHIDQERISQVWFAGVHTNVGGGYPDDSLAHVSLVWMVDEAIKCGLRFQGPAVQLLRDRVDENGTIYDSRKGLAGYYRYNPRRIDKLANDNANKVEVPRVKIHESVFRRIEAGHDGYAPIVLPQGFAVTKFDGNIVAGDTEIDPSIGKPAVAEEPKSSFAIKNEHVWNYVWWRRLAYFITLFATFALALMPLTFPALPKGACTSRLCFVSDLIETIGYFLPGFLSTWIDSFASHPGAFLITLAIIAAGLWFGGVFERKITDQMRRIWYAMPSLRPRKNINVAATSAPGVVGAAIERLRTQPAYQKTFRLITHTLLPLGFFAIVLYALIAIWSLSAFAIRSAVGGVCEPSGAVAKESSASTTFKTNALCTSTRLWAEKGATYRIRITIPANDPWTDNGIAAGPNGVPPDKASLLMSAGVPMRRHMGQAWYKSYARIGAKGSDEYPLDAEPSLSDDMLLDRKAARPRLNTCRADAKPNAIPNRADITFKSRIVARSSGELFVYVNDAVLDLYPLSLLLKQIGWGRDYYYCSNEGSGKIAVDLVMTPNP